MVCSISGQPIYVVDVSVTREAGLMETDKAGKQPRMLAVVTASRHNLDEHE
jgi:hypothetical protein